MKFQQMLLLREITAIKVATTLWNYADRCRIMVYIEESRKLVVSQVSRQIQSEIEDEVKLKISEFEIPESLKKEVADLVKPIGMEIFKWCDYHCLDSNLNLHPPNEFCWTTRGTIDLKKTAEGLVRDENLCLSTRYMLACIYCLEETIAQLWYKMSERCKAKFYDTKQFVMHHELVTFWTLFKRGEIARMKVCGWKSPYRFAFELAVVSGNIVATKYFWEKLTPEEKEASVWMAVKKVICKSSGCWRTRSDFPEEYYPEVLFFLLPQLEAEQQIEVLRHHAFAVLKCLMRWPFHSILMQTAIITLNSLSCFRYFAFLEIILQAIFEGHSYYNYSWLFTELWQKSTLSQKKYVASSANVTNLITMLLRTKEILNLKLILDEMAPSKKREYLCSADGQYCCCVLMDQNDWDLLQMVIQQCLQRKEDFVEFNKKIMGKSRGHKNHDHLIRLSYMLIHQQCKRKSIEDYYNNPSKKCAVTKRKKHRTVLQAVDKFKQQWEKEYPLN